MNRKPRILIVKPILPYPPDKGTKVLTFSVIKALRESCDITVLARTMSSSEDRDAKDLGKWCERVVIVRAPNKKSIVHRIGYKLFYSLKALLLRRSLKSLYDCPGVLVREAKRLANHEFDLVIIEYWQLYRLIDLFPRDRVALLTHDVDLLVNRDISLLERRLFQKIASVRRWLVERREEMAAYRKVKRILVLTSRDREMVKDLAAPGTDVSILPFGLDLDRYVPANVERNRNEVLFLGAMEAVFNRDALDFFARRVHPLLEDEKDLRIMIVGGELPPGLEYFADSPGVEVIGKVDDPRPFLWRATCLVIPLRFGGGLRIRVLEAMAAGLPIVCSGIAVAGMPFEAGKHYLEAESPEEFSSQIRKLLQSPSLAGNLASRASVRVAEEYSLDVQRERLTKLIEGIFDS
jgi:glycosyltransferase involved in cell wall biosynthesis